MPEPSADRVFNLRKAPPADLTSSERAAIGLILRLADSVGRRLGMPCALNEIRIAPGALTDDNEGFYNVLTGRILLPKETFDRLAEVRLAPGMTAEDNHDPALSAVRAVIHELIHAAGMRPAWRRALHITELLTMPNARMYNEGLTEALTIDLLDGVCADAGLAMRHVTTGPEVVSYAPAYLMIKALGDEVASAAGTTRTNVLATALRTGGVRPHALLRRVTVPGGLPLPLPERARSVAAEVDRTMTRARGPREGAQEFALEAAERIHGALA